MNNLQRLQMETKGIELSQQELIIYLQENGLNAHDEYNPQSLTSKRAIFSCALGILESLSNNPEIMKNIKMDDMSVDQFAENLQSRINQLERKIRTMRTDQSNGTDIFMLYM